MPTPLLRWNLSDSYVAFPYLRRAIGGDEFTDYAAGLVTSGLGLQDAAVVDGCLVVRPTYNQSVGLTVANLKRSSPATEVWGAWGQPGTFLVLATDGLATAGFSGRYAQSTTSLAAAEAFVLDWSAAVPVTASGFTWALHWGGSWGLQIDQHGKGYLWENSSGSMQLRGLKRLYNEPLWNRQLQLMVQAQRQQTLAVYTNDGFELTYDNPDATNYGTAGLAYYAYGAGTWDLSSAQSVLWLRQAPVRYLSALNQTYALVRGPVVDLGRNTTGALCSGVWDGQPGTDIDAWLEDPQGTIFLSGRYAVPAILMVSGSGGLYTPWVYDIAVEATEGLGTASLGAVDLTGQFESVSWEVSTNDQSAQVTVVLKPDTTLGLLTSALQRYCGYDVDGTPYLRAYLSADVETVGRYDRLTLTGRGRIQRLQYALLDGTETFADLVHTEAVRQLLRRGGLYETADFTIATDVSPVPATLPARGGGDDDPTTPRAGTNRYEYGTYICQAISGWVLCENPAGVIEYRPQAGVSRGAWQENITVAAGDWKRVILADTWRDERDEDSYRNEIWVVGEGPDGTPLLGWWIDSASQTDPTAANWLMQRRLAIYVDPSLNTEDMVRVALNLLVADMGTVHVRARFKSVFDATVALGDTLTARGFTWTVETIRACADNAAITSGMNAWTEYEISR